MSPKRWGLPREFLGNGLGRIRRNHSIQVQVDPTSARPVRFRRPPFTEILAAALAAAQFDGPEESSAGKYHRDFVSRAGSLANACQLLRTPATRKILDLLAAPAKRTGAWFVSTLGRNVINHFATLTTFGRLPNKTRDYYHLNSE